MPYKLNQSIDPVSHYEQQVLGCDSAKPWTDNYALSALLRLFYIYYSWLSWHNSSTPTLIVIVVGMLRRLSVYAVEVERLSIVNFDDVDGV